MTIIIIIATMIAIIGGVMRKRKRNKSQEIKVVLNTVAHHQLINPQSVSEQWSVTPSQLPPVYILAKVLYSMKFPLGQFTSVVLAVFSHGFLRTCSLAEHGNLESTWLLISTTQEKQSITALHSHTKARPQHCTSN